MNSQIDSMSASKVISRAVVSVLKAVGFQEALKLDWLCSKADEFIAADKEKAA